jgi:radical SAM superfamily enzyme YgiQ (UPF0313 family)
MKVKIVEPYYLDKRYDVRSLTPSLGPVVIASLLKQKGHEVEVISEYVTRLNFHELDEANLVGISLTTYNAGRGFEIAQRIRSPKVFGGFHASLMPEECLKYGDYVIKGDGHSVLQLADFLSEERTGDIHEIPNLVYKRNGHIVHTREESKAVNVIPDFGLVKNYDKMNLNTLLRIPMLANASRGCPHKCTFCCIREVYKDFRKKDKTLVVKSIQSLAKMKHLLPKFFPRGIWITDDNFFSDMKWAKEVLDELSRVRTGCELLIQARVDVAYDEELLELLQRAGISRLYLGIESLSQRSLDNFEKNASLADIEYAVKKIRMYGIDIYGLFIFGDDEFRKGDGARVAAFARRSGLSGVLIQPLTPFPGTELFRKLKAENRILHENWNEYNGKVVFQPKNVTPRELLEEIYLCYRKVFSPFQVMKYLLCGRKGLRLGLLGEAMFRHLEGMKMRRYMRECLVAKGVRGRG